MTVSNEVIFAGYCLALLALTIGQWWRERRAELRDIERA